MHVCIVKNRDLQRLSTTPFSLVLRKEYFDQRYVGISDFDCPQRDSRAVHYNLKRGIEVCTLVLCSLATVTSCIDASVRIVTKSPKMGPLLIFSISLAGGEAGKQVAAGNGAQRGVHQAQGHVGVGGGVSMESPSKAVSEPTNR